MAVQSAGNLAREQAPRPLVLIVDDEESIRRTLADVLEDEAFATIMAKNGAEALDMVQQHSPDLVFLDIWMPGWDGLETLERIKQIAPQTEVIMISGHATISNALEAMKGGARDFIEKPLDISKIVFSATRALENRGQSRAETEPSSVGEAVRDNDDVSTDSVLPPLMDHLGILSKGLAGRNIGQRTLKQSAILYGQGLHSGEKSGLVLEPLPLNSGIHFASIGGGTGTWPSLGKESSGSLTVPAFVDYVQSTSFATTLRTPTISAATIEHLLAALHAYGVTNLLIKCNREVPICDGSAAEFCQLIEEVGIEEQGGEWYELAVDRRIEVAADDCNDGSEIISIEPADKFMVSYHLDYPQPVGVQSFEFTLDGIEAFKRDISPARTFGFLRDIEQLQRVGLAAGGRLDNFILIGPDKIINTELRFPDEPVRHKILDIIGDLFLLGRPLRGHVRARMTGHSDNVKLLTALREMALS